jgi:hypothetical protein
MYRSVVTPFKFTNVPSAQLPRKEVKRMEFFCLSVSLSPSLVALLLLLNSQMPVLFAYKNF